MHNSRFSLVGGAALALALIVPAIVSCSAPAPGDGAETADEALSSGASTCPASATYGLMKFVPDGTAPDCPTVPGYHGAWVSSDDYPAQACNPTRDPGRGTPVFCTYVWTPARAHAAPDDAALEAVPGVYLAPFGHGGETSCGDVSSLPHAALLDDSGVVCPPRPHHPDGPAACTVCGVSLHPGVGKGMLALPTTSTLHTVVVGLSNGTQRIVTFDAAAHAAKAPHGSPYVQIPLPPLPRGLRYVDGPAPGYGYGRQHP